MPEALQAFLDWLSSGGSVSQYTDLVTDSGITIGVGTAEQLIGGNGAATTATQLVEVEGATATATGIGVMAVEFPAAVAAIAPCLGVIAGVGLYDLAPEFWTEVSNELVEAGQTIGGSVVGFVNELGETAFNSDVIEIIKNALLRHGVFDIKGEVAEVPSAFSSTLSSPLNNVISGTISYYQTASPTGNILWNDAYYPVFTSNASAATYHALVLSGNGLTKCILALPDGLALGTSIYLYDGNSFTLHGNGISYTYNGYTAYGVYFMDNSGGTYNIANSTDQPAAFSGDLTSQQEAIGMIIWSLIYGGLVSGRPNVQDGATIPTDDAFPTTFPTWHPWDVPDQDAYPVSLGVPGITQPDAQTGENVGEIAIGQLLDLLYDLAVDDNVIPDVAEADTDISVPIEEPIEEVIEDNVDPVEPIPPIIPIAPDIPLPSLETTRADRMFTVYNPTDAQINSLGGFLWTNNVIEQIKKMWQDPMDAIIAFHKVYAAPTTSGSSNIVFGYIDSGVSASVVSSQFTSVDCGSVNIREQLHNATDYSPFSKAMIYLPFIGIVDIDINDIMGSTVSVKYKVDMYTGTCLAMVYCQRTKDMPTAQLLYTFSGNASQQLPLTGASFSAAVGALLGLAGAGIAVASGGAGAAIGAVGAAHSLTQEMVHMQRSGGLSANAGIMGPRKPYIILERQNTADANGYYSYYGYPANKTVYLSNCSGYVRVKHINYKGTATGAEKAEIINLLKEGVII